MWALRRRPHNIVDLWDGQTYRRAIVRAAEPISLEVAQTGTPELPELQVVASAASGSLLDQGSITELLRRLLGLGIDLGSFYEFAATDKHLSSLALRFRGFKPPRYASIFEALLNGIACQQVTLNLGVQLLNRLAQTYGTTVTNHNHNHPLYILPQPEQLIEQSPESLRALGFSTQKSQTMLTIARAQLEGKLSLDELLDLDNEAVVSYLRQFKGIGRWTAEYVLLRGLGRLDVFPSGDSGARNSLRRWLNLDASLDYTGVSQTIDPWRTYGGLIYLHLLVKGLAETETL